MSEDQARCHRDPFDILDELERVPAELVRVLLEEVPGRDRSPGLRNQVLKINQATPWLELRNRLEDLKRLVDMIHAARFLDLEQLREAAAELGFWSEEEQPDPSNSPASPV